MMPLVQRRTRVDREGESNFSKKETHHSAGSQNGKILGIFAGLLVLAFIFGAGQVAETSNGTQSSTTDLKAPGVGFDIDSGVKVFVEFASGAPGSTEVTLGPHKATLLLSNRCSNPGLWIRFEGDALVTVELIEKGAAWEGSFMLPIEGKYSLVAYWYGCDGKGTLRTRKVLTNILAKDAAMVDLPNEKSLFPFAAWISSKKFTQASGIEQPYIFHDPLVPPSEAELFKTSESFVAQDSATSADKQFYSFGQLSNYELVCWVGGESANLLLASFLKLRSLVNIHQRPFKFHFYNSTSFTKPDASWTEETKKKFRKCKHILVSMDPVKTPLTQAEYIRQVKNFIGHLLKAFPDDTFPIWMFTVLESPIKPTNCLKPTLPRTSDHPCNTALKDMFRDSPFPERVRFLDGTDMTLPQLGENPVDVATAIALRIFVFVGKQVEAWRAVGQVGNIKGLQRGDHLEPNFELVPYLDWDK